MPARRPLVHTLEGRNVALTPLGEDDFPSLREAIGRPEVFAGGFGGGPSGLPSDDAAFEVFARVSYTPASDAIPFAVRLRGGPDDGALVGATKLGDLDLPNESAHIGWTGFDPRVWGTAVNPEVKLLMLGLAFDHGFGRVKLQADAVNARSRAAIAKLGASFEGVHRRAMRRPDGTWRDTAVYAIVVDEWPAVRAGLEARLAAWGDRPVTLAGSPRER
ncbi:GNAT family N-acetyltransferase [Agromyces bracchium]|uniref:GNAT family N-acetyltransferase n=1 Tax=Agromyces bracchium TaxID=88376 RepID=A0A6I3M5S8_9MICO|nr:GNAT family protein [Agromyces bracchium]MTH68118.1 GNAT family N-acetyltransferase [Agromyces bracchium]